MDALALEAGPRDDFTMDVPRILLGIGLAAGVVGPLMADPPKTPRPTPVHVAPPPRGQELSDILNDLKKERRSLEETFDSAVQDFQAGIPQPVANNKILALRIQELMQKMQGQRIAAKADSVPFIAPLPSLLKPPPTRPKKVEPEHAPIPAHTPSEPDTHTPAAEPTLNPVDALALGQTQFREKKYPEAAHAFRQVNLYGLKAEDRMPVQYLLAMSLLHSNKTDEAATLLREVAGSVGDETLAQAAQWQLSSLQWRLELSNQLQDMKQKRDALEKKQ